MPGCWRSAPITHSRGEAHRNICLIPSIAHGTNPASAAMAGLQVVVVGCDRDGNIDVADLRAKAAQARGELAALMVTYPSTHGVFEAAIREICEIVHDARRPGLHGRRQHERAGRADQPGGDRRRCVPSKSAQDVLHPAWRRRPGRGTDRRGGASGAVSAEPSAARGCRAGDRLRAGVGGAVRQRADPADLVCLYPHDGRGGTEARDRGGDPERQLHRRTGCAAHYPVLYTGPNGMVAHECIIDCRGFQAEAGVMVEDIAKRLMDFGFHAPTMSWPVAGTLMIEPTESESKAELDRFCEAMIAIRAEIAAIAAGKLDRRTIR